MIDEQRLIMVEYQNTIVFSAQHGASKSLQPSVILRGKKCDQ